VNRIEKFQKERERLNDLVLSKSGLNTKRFFNLDRQTYQEGALKAGTKELMGLVASLVLRCDDCIMYHLVRCRELGINDQELEESIAVALTVGGSITIPHIRRAWDAWEEMKK
jgi:AhpD family alkylhydroperoxidase